MATEKLIIELDAKTSKLDARLKKTESQLDKLDKTVKKTDTDFKRMATTMVAGAVAASAALGLLIKSATTFAKELQVAATRNKETVENMQAWAFAADTVGISLEKLGDIGKDTNEKIGEFLATGGGGFVDFIDVMKLTNAEGVRLAETFSTMAGTDVLQEMVKQMEAAGVSGNQMSFALEGLASDTTDLIPLLVDGGEALGVLKDNFNDVVNVLSSDDISDLARVAGAFELLQSSFNASSRKMIAQYSEEIIKAINVMLVLGTTSSNAFDVIAVGWGNIISLGQAALTDLVNGTDTLSGVVNERTKMTIEALDTLLGVTGKKFEILITGGSRALKDSVKQDRISYGQKLDVFSKYTKAASIIQGAFFEDNKAIQAGIIVADTATGVMRAFATSSNIYEAYANAAVVTATGIAQLANLKSASRGGGSISGGDSSASSSQQQQSFQPDEFSQDTSINVIGENSSSTSSENFTFQNEGGTSADELLTEFINDALKSGRLSRGRT